MCQCRALWNGTGPTIWRLSVGLGLQMSVLEGLKEGFARMHMRSHLGDAGVAGAALPSTRSGRVQECKAMLGIKYTGQERFTFCAGPGASAPQRLTKAEAFLAGGLARGVAAAATCPVTVVKTRMEYGGGTAVYKVPTLPGSSVASPKSSYGTLTCLVPMHCARVHAEEAAHRPLFDPLIRPFDITATLR